MPRRTVSVIVLTQNVRDGIRDCLESARWADEIVVVDSHSTDSTVEICRECADKVLERTYVSAADQKNFALQHVTGDYVLVVDADERVTPELADEIQKLVAADELKDAYLMPRRLVLHGRWLRRAGLYPDAAVRFFRKGVGRFREQRVHAPLVYKGTTGRLRNAVIHYSFRGVGDLMARMNDFSSRRALDLFDEGRRVRWYHLVWPAVYFIKNYVLRGGFLDGVPGLCVWWMMTVYQFALWAKLWEAQRKSAADDTAAEA
jgi:glycosyltransferase involved in cell wall biosynthesis